MPPFDLSYGQTLFEAFGSASDRGASCALSALLKMSMLGRQCWGPGVIVALGETNENCQMEARLSDRLKLTDANPSRAVLLYLFIRNRQSFSAYCIKTCVVLFGTTERKWSPVWQSRFATCPDIDRTILLVLD
jgi:hypothetical protein